MCIIEGAAAGGHDVSVCCACAVNHVPICILARVSSREEAPPPPPKKKKKGKRERKKEGKDKERETERERWGEGSVYSLGAAVSVIPYKAS